MLRATVASTSSGSRASHKAASVRSTVSVRRRSSLRASTVAEPVKLRIRRPSGVRARVVRRCRHVLVRATSPHEEHDDDDADEDDQRQKCRPNRLIPGSRRTARIDDLPAHEGDVRSSDESACGRVKCADQIGTCAGCSICAMGTTRSSSPTVTNRKPAARKRATSVGSASIVLSLPLCSRMMSGAVA